MSLFDMGNPRDPRPIRGEGIQHYIERVVMGLGQTTRTPFAPRRDDVMRFFEPSYVFAPYVAMVMLTRATRGAETMHQ